MMLWRRALATVAVAAVVGAAMFVHFTSTPQRFDPVFSALRPPTMPIALQLQTVTSSWFCPGVPIPGDDVGGSVTVANPTDGEITGRLTAFTDAADGAPVEERFTISPRAVQEFDLKALQPNGAFASALIEIDGGFGVVEQRALHPAGNAISPCANNTSSNWFFADAFTAASSIAQLVITNPYPDPVNVDVSYSVPSNDSRELTFRGLADIPIPGFSVKVVSQDLMPINEQVMSAKVTSNTGRVIVGRSQQYLGAGRLGYTMNLGAPALFDQLYFADGEVGDGIVEQYNVYNGSDQDVEVSVVFTGINSTGFFNDQTLIVPAGRVRSLLASEIEGMPEGRHGAIVTAIAGPVAVDDGWVPPITVERIITRPAGDSVATTAVLGVPGNFVQIAQRWTIAAGIDQSVEDALVVSLLSLTPATVTVKALVAGGAAPVPGLEAIEVPTGGIVTIPLTDPAALGVPLIIESTAAVMVERLFPRGDNLRGRSGSVAIPG